MGKGLCHGHPWRWGSLGACVVLLMAGCGSGQAGGKHHKRHHHGGKQVAMVVRHTHRHHRAGQTALGQYARGVLPLVDRSTDVFRQAASATSTNPANLLNTCGQYGSQIDILQSEVEGVPHPYPWYHPVGRAHHQMMSVYHYMLGALASCQSAASSGDTATAQASAADVVTAAGRMQELDGTIHSLASRR